MRDQPGLTDSVSPQQPVTQAQRPAAPVRNANRVDYENLTIEQLVAYQTHVQQRREFVTENIAKLEAALASGRISRDTPNISESAHKLSADRRKLEMIEEYLKATIQAKMTMFVER